MRYTVYRTVNLVNGKVYVGQHATKNPNDSYIGSGSWLRQAVKKYGRESFKKEVLFVFDNPEEMAAKEAEIVTQEFVDREDTYNLVPGGHLGDAWYEARKGIPTEDLSRWGKAGNEVLKEKLKTSPEYREVQRRNGERIAKLWNTSGRPRFRLNPLEFLGRKHSEETIVKMRGKSAGSSNSQFGTLWICKSGENPKKIPGSEVSSYLERGWSRGRKP